MAKDFCKDEVEITQGQILHNGHVYTYQTSCKANTQNAGDYYNWYAATAGQGRYNNLESEGSICPKGWRLLSISPSTNKVFETLVDGVKNSNVRLRPFSYIKTGEYSSSNKNYRGYSGSYWTGVPTTDRARSQYLKLEGDSLTLWSDYGISTTGGGSVRCINH